MWTYTQLLPHLMPHILGMAPLGKCCTHNDECWVVLTFFLESWARIRRINFRNCLDFLRFYFFCFRELVSFHSFLISRRIDPWYVKLEPASIS
jgi:hypothetical protein